MKVNLTGRTYGTHVYTAKHKKNGSVVLRIHPLRYKVASRKPLDPKEYKKKDALVTLNFENTRAVENFVAFVARMRKVNTQKDRTRGLNPAFVAHYNEMVTLSNDKFNALFGKLDEVQDMLKLLTGLDKLGPEEMEKEIQESLEKTPKDALDRLSYYIRKEKEKRAAEPKKEEAAAVAQ